MKLSDIRIDYALKSLDIVDVAAEPLIQFKVWFEEAVASKVLEVNAMNLSTVKENGYPNSRIVLLKGIDHGLVFFTNYESEKGKELANNPKVALTFFWPELQRQVRFLGKVEKVSRKESNDYFFSRPFPSQIGAWASPQSQVIPNRTFLEENEKLYLEIYEKEEIQRPPHWGGFRVIIEEAEFWQGRPSRLHDRIRYRQQSDLSWKLERIAP
ncbi:pyridoxamine 5'-phosphate oxidase [Belliella kenyensis]|uniref:Pyridoxine/pyridoxamine 5'-phosphate oxidase n=1 Tax=Belliella kenyensis TaxID=1472724 RepID=A0ABV8EKN0_9BACT|nr:pyridoxamine 5'-phosphate oxidase [Belliella kenyensis]MCH7400433.1 pyridoxamine 5'-phosphate oxidase [Belliella kenyensis]MDN3604550.1 pyridoxamine 5'-phosphate oxidase [Belliella kenyensis]